MATVTLKNLLAALGFAGTPYGNAYVEKFTFQTTSAGVLTNSDKTTAFATTDKARIGVIPAGTRIDGALAIISDAFRASTTGKIGFEYVDGTDSTAVPQDDDYFFAALALDATGRTFANNAAVRPVVLPKDAYVIMAVAVADMNAVGILDLVVNGAVVGYP